MTVNSYCPLCSFLGVRPTEPAGGDSARFDCPNCGLFTVSGTLLPQLAGLSPRQKRVLSHTLRRMQRAKPHPPPLLTTALMNELLRSSDLPSPSGLIDNLIIHMGQRSDGPGAELRLEALEIQAVLGALDERGVNWATKHAFDEGYLSGIRTEMSGGTVAIPNASLTPKGWQRYEELQSAATESRLAFMAMKFGDPVLDTVFAGTFKVAAKRAGYDLRKLDEEPQAGLIDDRLRLEIRRSRFTVADLTHGNRGAYWEAGYAEGLGRPVIYTCRTDVFADKTHEDHPHFDTNHRLMVLWDPNKPEEAEESLVTTIRATLPAEAVLDDPT